MDPISYGVAAKQKQRIEKVIAEPDSTSGVITVPQVIATGETITVPAGRVAVLPNIQVDGTLNVQGDVFIPSGATMSKVVDKVASTDNAVVRFNGTTGQVQNSGVIIDDSGHLIVSSGVTLGTSVGVYNAANTLDDYEEGSWTPSGIVTYGTVTFTPNSSSGRYIKIGNQVTCWFQLEVTTTSVNGNFGITGLPFSAANNSFSQNGGVCRQNATGGQTFFIESISGSSVGNIRRYDNGGIGVGYLMFQGQFSYSIEQ